MIRFAPLLLAGALALPGFASAATVTLTADADAVIRGGAPDTPRNDDTVFAKRSSDIAFRRKAFVQFDLSDIVGTILGARFVLTQFGTPDVLTTGDFSVFALEDSRGDDWDETTLTSNNAPAHSIALDYDDNSGSVDVGTISVDAPANGAVFSLDSPKLLDFLLNGLGSDGLVTLILSRDDLGLTGPIFASKDNPDFAGPQLILEVDSAVVPLPATALLLLSGLAGLGVAARHRA